jgi:hypothetical protein
MTATTIPTTTVETSTTRRPLLRAGVRYGVLAAVATTAIAAVASAAGISFETAPEEAIPLLGFAQLTLVFTFVGVGIAKLVKDAGRFTKIAVALVALSFVPDLTFGFDAASAATLILIHVVAAAIVIPGLRDRLDEA